MIPIGLILLYIEYRYYKNASLNEMVFYKGTVISFLTVFAFLALIAGNIFYLIYGRQLKKKNVSNDIDYLMKQFRMSLFYAFIIELLFFLLGLSMASTFTLFLSI